MPIWNEAAAQMPDKPITLTQEEQAEESFSGIPDSQLKDITNAASFAYDTSILGKEEYQRGAAKKTCTVFVPLLVREIHRLRDLIMNVPIHSATMMPKESYAKPGGPVSPEHVATPKRSRGRPRKVPLVQGQPQVGSGKAPS